MNYENMNLDDLFKEADTCEAKLDFAATISIYREALKRELPIAARLKALDGLTRTLLNAKDLDGAEKAATEMCEFLAATFGATHKNVGLGLNRLIRVATDKNELARAADLGKQAVEIFQKAVSDAPDDKKGAAKQQLAAAYFALANNCFNSKDYGGAEEASRSALDLWLEIEGDKGLTVANLCNNLGRIVEIQGRRDEGIELHKQAVAIRREILGDHQDTAFSLGNLGTSYAESGQLTEAISILREAVDIYDKLGMGGTPAVESHRQNLKTCMQTLDEQGKKYKCCSM